MNNYRTIWISDLHLGTRGCSADKILRFLKENNADTIYLVGDIVDGWRLSKKFYWPQSHNDVIQKLLKKARKGTKIIWVAGNHDEFLNNFIGNFFGNIEIVDEISHTINDKKILIIHGDKFDGITKYHKWLALLGDYAYTVLLVVNSHLHSIRKYLGLKPWSLSSFLKQKVKQAVNFISDYETTISNECVRRKYDGIICGHIHKAEIKTINNILYMNCGDFVEGNTALVEDFDGNITLLHVTDDSIIPIETIKL